MSERKTEILFQNLQWSIDRGGMTIVGNARPYRIYAHQSNETRDDIGYTYYKWPLQLAEKTWIDIEAFKRVLEIDAGKYKLPID